MVKKKSGPEKEAPKAMSAKDIMAVMGKLDQERGSRSIALEEKKASDFCSTGLLSLDLIMGGGYYGGQVFQYFGAAHSGKSTLGYTSAGWATGTAGIPTAFFDHEGTTDKAYTIRLGVDYDMVMYFRPETGEWTYDYIDNFCKQLPDKYSGRPQAIMFVDTVKAMKPKKWLDDPDNMQPAIPASMHSKGWDKIQTLITNKHVSIVAANQIRSNVGNPYQAAEKVPGGNAWEFATTNLVRVSRGGKNAELPDGRVFQPVKFKTYKNKNFIPMQECQVFLELGVGWDIASDVVEFCKLAGYYFKRGKNGRIVKSGGLPSLRGLGEDVDDDFRSSAALEELIREQGREGPIFQACRAALESGEAIERFRKSKKKDEDDEEEAVDLLAVKRVKRSNLEDEAATEGGSSGADELEASSEDEEEVLPMTLGKKKKSSTKTTATRKKRVSVKQAPAN